MADWRTKYTKIRLLNEGGQAQVFEVRNAAGAIFALKQLLDPVNQEAQARLRREVEVQRKVSSPNVAPVLDSDAEGSSWLVMPRADAFLKLRTETDLSGLGRNIEELTDAELLAIVRQVVNGLQAAHDLGYVHRDLKPSNLLLLRNTELSWTVSDWGIVRKPHGQTTLVRTSSTIGTLEFAAPEQLRDAHNVDFLADYYSVGRLVAASRVGTPLAPGVEAIPNGVWRKFVRSMTQALPEKRPKNAGEIGELLKEVEVDLGEPTPSDRALHASQRLQEVPTDRLAAEILLSHLEESEHKDVIFYDEMPHFANEAWTTICAVGSDSDLHRLVQEWKDQPWGTRAYDHMSVALDAFLKYMKHLVLAQRSGPFEDASEVYVQMASEWDRWKHAAHAVAWLGGLTGDAASVMVRVLSRNPTALEWFRKYVRGAKVRDDRLRRILY